MFCQKCGVQMPDGTAVCGGCGTTQVAQGATAQGAYRPPNFETKTVQCYPSDYEEQKTITFYQRCGWQVVSSTRHQERHGDTTSTFIRITVQRDRNMPNYDKIRELSARAEGRFDKVSKKKSTGWPVLMILGGAFLLFISLITGGVGVGCSLALGELIDVESMIMPLVMAILLLAGGLVLVILGARLIGRNKKHNRDAEQRDRDRDKEIESIVAECERLVNGQ